MVSIDKLNVFTRISRGRNNNQRKDKTKD